MPRGRKQSNRPSAGGVVRNDYHRPNRKENKSTHKHSFGAQAPASVFEKDGIRVLVLPVLEVERRATLNYRNYGGATNYAWPRDRICVQWIRHSLTNYNQLVKERQRMELFDFAGLSFKVFEAIAEAYPNYADECKQQHIKRADRGHYGRVRIIKTPELNAHFTEHSLESDLDETVSDRGALTSLASSRFIYLPPFLKPAEIRQRRFGGQLNMNDRWWEWEEELDVMSLAGRPKEGAYFEAE